MLRTRATAMLVAVIGLGVCANQAVAQDRADATTWRVGAEFWADQRGAHATDYQEDYPAGAPVPVPKRDEAWANHAVDYVARHTGVFATIGFETGGETTFGGALGLGVVNTGLKQNIEASSLMWQLTIGVPTYGARTTLDNDSDPGFGALLRFDMTHRFGESWWFRSELLSHQGIASLPDQVMFGNNLRGGSRNSYTYWLGALSGVVGYDVEGSGVAPYAGLDFSYYHGVYETEARPVGTLLGLADQTVTMGNWSYVRVLLGVDLGADSMASRLQLSIWNPTRDLGFAFSASLAF